MTLDKALKILTIHNDHNPDFTDVERREAHQLGIEALGRVKSLRIGKPGIQGRPDRFSILPGETEE